MKNSCSKGHVVCVWGWVREWEREWATECSQSSDSFSGRGEWKGAGPCKKREWEESCACVWVQGSCQHCSGSKRQIPTAGFQPLSSARRMKRGTDDKKDQDAWQKKWTNWHRLVQGERALKTERSTSGLVLAEWCKEELKREREEEKFWI